MRAVFTAVLIATIIAIGLSPLMSVCPLAAAETLGPLMVYKILQPTVNSTSVENIASTVFGLPSPYPQELEDIYVVNGSAPLYLEVYKPSGSIWYADLSRLYEEDYEAAYVGEDVLKDEAIAFLTAAGLLPAEAEFFAFGNSTTTVGNGTAIVNSYDVTFSFTLNGHPVDGAGAKIRVSFDGLEPIGVHYVWRECTEYSVFDGITEEEAEALLIEKFKAEYKAGILVNITDSRLAYDAEPENTVQEFLQPYYLFDGVLITQNQNETHTEEINFQTQRIPATVFSPQASIENPKHGERFLTAQTIQFNASVQHGGGPYSYSWSWNGTVLSSSPQFDAILPCGNEMRTGNETDDIGLIPHTIQLKVTDDLGNVATDYVTVVVTTLLGDVSGDGKVDILDIARAAKAFGSSPGHPRWNFMVDLDNNNKVDIKDIATAAKQFGETAPKSFLSSAHSVEQSQHSVIAVALVLVPAIFIARRKRRRSGGLAGPLLLIIIGGAFSTSLISVKALTWINVGIESCGGDLEHYATASSTGFKNELRSDGATIRFHWKEWSAWEQDFKYRYASGGGKDFRYIDAVDFAYFVGHGHPTYIMFLSQVDSQRFYFTRARWGGTAGGDTGEQADLEWIALESCNTLQETHNGQSAIQRWQQAFQGLHYVLGFHTRARVSETLGGTFAEYMTRWFFPRSIRRSWIRATQAVQPSDRWGAYIRATSLGADTRNEYLPGHGPYSVNDPNPSTQQLIYTRWQC